MEIAGGVLKTILSDSIVKTHEIAEDLIKNSLQIGDLVLISGEMGAGKTTFVQGMAAAMQINQTINSPTFTRLHIYHGNWTLNHLDLYNIIEFETLESFGIYDYIEPEDAICVVEWWEKFPTVFANLPHWHVAITVDNNLRKIEVNFRETLCQTKSQN